ncbi:MAG: hypothetical protein HQL52_19285 [Magnetococcales bacterium]|nr:hypothetical protein [Magnetococcales bacterium]
MLRIFCLIRNGRCWFRDVVVFIFAGFVLSGCGGLMSAQYIENTMDRPGYYGYISENESEFDQTKTLSMEPAFLDKGPVFIGIRWNSAMDSEEYILVVERQDAVNFDPEEPLQFNVDGLMYDLKPIDGRSFGYMGKKLLGGGTSFMDPVVDVGNKTQKEFWVTEDFLHKVANGQKTIVRAHYLQHKFTESRVDPTGDSLVIYEKYPYAHFKGAIPKFIRMRDEMMGY